ncbi:MAG: hypothetical protein A3E79_06820 [Burkholderiales bacterium RIFCSPHIGHO2_12_FULL_61_11]|nr:MAG: hypothetical protein A3E79_06820 [Burkholderiales bacterium RIFCSPHIGHO2_12_FULL_61_11]
MKVRQVNLLSKRLGKRGRSRQAGVTSIEYGLIAALIAIAIIGGLSATGGANGSIWTVWTDKVLAAFGP